jgi:uncharacterized protein YbjT (DUF2867 family)
MRGVDLALWVPGLNGPTIPREVFMFVVAGITGQTGAAAAETLLAAGQPVRAIVRDVAKSQAWAARGVELVQGDVGDVAALTRALTGAQGAYLLVPPNPAHPDPTGNQIDVAAAIRQAALAAKLPKLVLLSSEAAHLDRGNGPIKGLHMAEAILALAAPQVTFLRASYFQENWQSGFGLAKAQGILPSFKSNSDAKRSMVATKDIGRVAGELLLDPAPPAVVELSGREPTSAKDVAAAMSEVLGKPIQLVQPPRDQWVGILTGAGLGQPYAELLAELNDGINSGHVQFSGRGVQMRGRISIAETIADWARA